MPLSRALHTHTHRVQLGGLQESSLQLGSVFSHTLLPSPVLGGSRVGKARKAAGGGREEERGARPVANAPLRKQTHPLSLRHILWLDSCCCQLCQDRQHPAPPRLVSDTDPGLPPCPAPPAMDTQSSAPQTPPSTRGAARLRCSRSRPAASEEGNNKGAARARPPPRAGTARPGAERAPSAPRPSRAPRGSTHSSVHGGHRRRSAADSSAELEGESHQPAFLRTGCTAHKIMF